MAVEPLWLTFADVDAIHAGQLLAFGGAAGTRDENLVHGAIASPRHLHLYDGEEDLLVLAVRLCLAIARNHGFIDGNKRTGAAAMVEFIAINGVDIVVPEVADEDGPYLARLIIMTLEKRIADGDLVDRLRPFVSLIDDA